MSSDTPFYTYTGRNLLDKGEYYMYSQYHGQPFLLDFISLRTRYVDECEARYLLCLKHGNRDDIRRILFEWRSLLGLVGDAFSPEIRAIHLGCDEGAGLEEPVGTEHYRLSLSDLDTLNEVSTGPVLHALLSAIAGGDAFGQEPVYRWLSRFLQRFEITKRLYACYTPEMKPACQDFRNLAHYGLLSLGLTLYYRQTGNLKMLNGTLKVNDVLCSVPIEQARLEELLLMVLAIRKEVDNVTLLISSQGVVL
ncbi:hypothetical protein ACFLX3_05560 [Chloroflexota bacterium]